MKKLLPLFCSLFILSSCAKLSYIVDQGVGQASLEWNGRDNKKVLADKEVSKEHKQKIKKIIEYKEFFYSYFNQSPTNIYDQTTFLDGAAVTYLVVASRPEKIEPLQHSFPIMGSFPYLGFFDLKDAREFASKLAKQGYETFVRPVYAYSTLNQWLFDDNILSSFFTYNDLELAELIFHELFHTIFFVKSEVSLNENLAQYFSRELVFEYFNYSQLQKEEYIKEKGKEKRLTEKLVDLTNRLQERYEQKGRDPAKALETRKAFMDSIFRPEMKLTCEELELKNCWPLKNEWNNARFAAFLTYESGQNRIEKLIDQKAMNLKEFYTFLAAEREKFHRDGGDQTFEKRLFNEY